MQNQEQKRGRLVEYCQDGKDFPILVHSLLGRVHKTQQPVEDCECLTTEQLEVQDSSHVSICDMLCMCDSEVHQLETTVGRVATNRRDAGIRQNQSGNETSNK